jgi:nucleotide-binding universal stress UspA family protein
VDLIMVAQPRTVADMPYAGSRLAVRLASKCHCSLASIPAGRELKFDRALAPIRNSECSRRALQSAIDLASAAGDEFEIIAHYVYPIAAGYARVGLSYEEFGEALQGCAEQEYRKLMETVDVGSARITPVFTGDTEDNPARHIAQEIVERDVDVVFIGSRGRTGPAGIILGHVTEALIMSSPAPVVAIKEKGENIGLLKALGIIM